MAALPSSRDHAASSRTGRSGDADARRSLGGQVASTLVTLNQALFVGTWFLTVFFLLAAGALALTSGRRALGWSAIGIALITLVATAVVVTIAMFETLYYLLA